MNCPNCNHEVFNGDNRVCYELITNGNMNEACRCKNHYDSKTSNTEEQLPSTNEQSNKTEENEYIIQTEVSQTGIKSSIIGFRKVSG